MVGFASKRLIASRMFAGEIAPAQGFLSDDPVVVLLDDAPEAEPSARAPKVAAKRSVALVITSRAYFFVSGQVDSRMEQKELLEDEDGDDDEVVVVGTSRPTKALFSPPVSSKSSRLSSDLTIRASSTMLATVS